MPFKANFVIWKTSTEGHFLWLAHYKHREECTAMTCVHMITFAQATQNLPVLPLRHALPCGAQSLLVDAHLSNDMATFSQFWLQQEPDTGKVHGW